jgi:uncharacterized protein
VHREAVTGCDAEDRGPLMPTVGVLTMAMVLAAAITAGGSCADSRDSQLRLYLASESGDTGAVTRLLREGVDPNTSVEYSQSEPASTPLIAAVSGGHEAVMVLLLDAGAEPGRPDAVGRVPLDYAEKPQTWTLLLERGAEVNVHRGKVGTPLMFASAAGNLAKVDALLAASADPNLATDDGETPLRVAAGNIQIATVEKLLAAGAHVNVKTNKGETVLMAAFDNQYRFMTESNIPRERTPKLVKILVASGVDVSARSDKGDTALSLAEHGRRFPVDEVVDILKSAGAK